MQAIKYLQQLDGYGKTTYEHYQDITKMEKQHNIVHEDVMVILLSMSLFEQFLDWYRTLPPNSISTWAYLA